MLKFLNLLRQYPTALELSFWKLIAGVGVMLVNFIQKLPAVMGRFL